MQREVKLDVTNEAWFAFLSSLSASGLCLSLNESEREKENIPTRSSLDATPLNDIFLPSRKTAVHAYPEVNGEIEQKLSGLELNVRQVSTGHPRRL